MRLTAGADQGSPSACGPGQRSGGSGSYQENGAIRAARRNGPASHGTERHKEWKMPAITPDKEDTP